MYAWVRVNRHTGEITHSVYDTGYEPHYEDEDYCPIRLEDTDETYSNYIDITEDDDHICFRLDEEELIEIFSCESCIRFPNDKELVRKILEDHTQFNAIRLREELEVEIEELPEETENNNVVGLMSTASNQNRRSKFVKGQKLNSKIRGNLRPKLKARKVRGKVDNYGQVIDPTVVKTKEERKNNKRLMAMANTNSISRRRINQNHLQFGDSGEEVLALQQKIIEAYGEEALPIYGADGVFGIETRDAITKIQKQNGLKYDCCVGPKTMAMLDKIIENKQKSLSQKTVVIEIDGKKYSAIIQGEVSDS